MKDKLHLVALLLLAAFAFQVIGSMRLKSPSHDEYLYIGAGYSYFKTGEIQISFEHPPLMKYLAAFPLLFLDGVEMDFEDEYWQMEPKNQFGFSYRFLWSQDVDRVLFAARMPFVLLALALGVLVYVWGRELWGRWAGLFALGLYSFSPSLVAHARFTTMDLGLTAFYTACLYAYWKYTQRRTRLRLLAIGILLGLALGAKFSGIFLLPVLGLLLFLRWQQAGEGRVSGFFHQVVCPYAVILSVAFLVIWALYLFPSNLLFYWNGMMEVNENHDPNVPSYLNGEFSLTKFPFYFVYCFVYKTPDLVLLLLLASVMLFRRFRSEDIHTEWVLCLPPVLLFVATQALANDLGIRYLLPVYPFLCLFIARLVPLAEDVPWARGVLAAGLFLVALDVARIYPNYLAYFNRLSGGPEHGYRRLADSNLDWGQDLPLLKKHLDTAGYGTVKLRYPWPGEPAYYGIDAQPLTDEEWYTRPRPGTYIISIASLLEGLYIKELADREKIHANTDWLNKYQPSARIGYSFYVYQFIDE